MEVLSTTVGRRLSIAGLLYADQIMPIVANKRLIGAKAVTEKTGDDYSSVIYYKVLIRI